MAATKPFRELAQGDEFSYQGGNYRKVSHTHASLPADDAIVYPIAPETLVGAPEATPEDDEPRTLDDLTVEQLKALADEHEVEHTSGMRKADLIAALKAAGVEPPAE